MLEQKRLDLSKQYSDIKTDLERLNSYFIKKLTFKQFRKYQESSRYWYARTEIEFKAITSSTKLLKVYNHANALHLELIRIDIELDIVLEKLERFENSHLRLVG